MPSRSPLPYLFSLLSSLIFLMVGCRGESLPLQEAQISGMRTRLDTVGVSLVLPEGWEVRTQNSSSRGGTQRVSLAHVVDSRSDSLAYQDLVVTRHDDLGLLKRFSWVRGWDRSQEERLSWEFVEKISSSDHRMPFESGAGFVYRWEPQASTPSRAVPLAKLYVFYLVEGSRAYRISIGGTETDFEEQSGMYERILRSIRFSV